MKKLYPIDGPIIGPIIGAVALGVIAAGAFVAIRLHRGNDVFAQCRSIGPAGGHIVAGGHIGGPFTLLDTSGKAVTSKQVLAKPSLVYFGYTNCADLCPLDNARNVSVAEDLTKAGNDVIPIFISVDPKRDTPKVMKEYTANFSPRMVGLTGTPDAVASAAREYKVFYNIPDPQDKFYTVNHTAFTYLMLPGYGLVDIFPHTATAKAMVERISCYLDKAKT